MAALLPMRAGAEITLWGTNILGYGDKTFLYPSLSSTRAGACHGALQGYEAENKRLYDFYVSRGQEAYICPGRVELIAMEPLCTFRVSSTFARVADGITCADHSIWPISYYPYNNISIPDGVVAQSKASGPEQDNVCRVGNPINPGNGNKYQIEVDYVGAGEMPLTFVRHYNSLGLIPDTVIGRRWRHTFDRRVVFDPTRNQAIAYRADGAFYVFAPLGAEWLPDADLPGRLEQNLDNAGQPVGWRYRVAQTDEIESYDADGRLLSVENRAGVKLALQYVDHPLSGRLLERVTDFGGRALVFAYDTLGRISTMTDPGGGVYRYEYESSSSNLVKATYPDLKTRMYHYEISGPPIPGSGFSFASALTGITNENGVRYATYGYDAGGRAILTEHAGGAERYEVSYTPGSASIIDSLGATRAQSFQTLFGVPKTTGISGSPAPGIGPAAQTLDPATGQIVSRTNWNGVQTAYTRADPNGRTDLETSRTEAVGKPEGRTVGTEWLPDFRLPTRIAEPGRETTLEYDAAGNVIRRTVRDTTTNESHAWTYTHNAQGQVLTVDGPRTDAPDVTTYEYYPTDATFEPGRRGQLSAVVNALGHRTEIRAYNALGLPTKIADPNGLVTTLEYDLRQRLVARAAGGETTRYEYDGVGLLTKITRPDGTSLAYAYDAARRLTGIADNAGNRIAYELDAMGNRTKEDVFADSGALVQTQSRVYSSLNRLAQEIGAQGQTTGFEYDDQGNLVRVAAPLSRNTTQSYDALDRLARMVDPKGGEIHYGYDALDRLVSVTDPRSLTTRYEYNALGDMKQQVSPDTGTTTHTLDAAGNVLARTNANGTSSTYTYDALNRVTRIVYSDGQVEAYSYDQGANGLGRLTGITDSSGTTGYAYDAHGRVTRETRTIGEQSYITAYSYDTAGRLATMTAPSGRVFSYTRDALGRVTQIDTSGNNLSQVLVQGVTYFPFGGVKGFSYGSLAGYTRTIDDDGRISAYSRASESRALIYDEASRITAIRDPGNAANDATYGYDELDRLTGWTQGTTSQGYAYDATGNRISLAVGGTNYPYSVDPASNRLNGAAGPAPASYSHDASGNLASSSATGTFTHDARLRLVRSTVAGIATDYRLNALGQRVAKLGSSGSTHYHYDAAGRLIAESDAAGRVQKEYVWLGTTPVVMIESPAPPGAICPATPELQSKGGFIPYERRERMEVHSGRPGERGWEWGLGTNARDFEASAREDVNWVSGKPYAFRLTYDGTGNASVRVSDAGVELFALTWTGDMDVGNALRFVVRSPEGIGAGNSIRADITSIDGQPVAATLATKGDDSFSREARIFAGESLKDGYTVEGTVTFVFTGDYPPLGNRLDFHVTAGNVACADSGSGAGDAQAKIYYIHPDHLDTPRVLTDDANSVVWHWDSDPYGAYPADEDPDADGTKVTLNLRFPGQYFDRETNLHYNYFRDYDPATGRYVQSDPIGLEGGLNTYGYANQNPLAYVDPDGQFGQLLLGAAAAIALWALPELLIPDAPVVPGSGVVYPATFPDGSGLLKCVAALGIVKKLSRVGARSASLSGTGNTLKEVTLSRTFHGEAARHAEDAIRAGKPDVLTIDRAGAGANRRASTGPFESVPGKHLDEYPPAMFKEGGSGASVRPLSPRDNMSAGACIGNACRGLPDGTHVRIKIGD